MITNLQANGTFTEVLSDLQQQIAYLQSTSNDGLLSSNCTGYFSGLESAKKADRDVQETKRQQFKDVMAAFYQVVKSALGKSDS